MCMCAFKSIEYKIAYVCINIINSLPQTKLERESLNIANTKQGTSFTLSQYSYSHMHAHIPCALAYTHIHEYLYLINARSDK